jgi:hypothetical protein
VTNARTTTRDPGTPSHQPAPSNTPAMGPTPDRPTTTGSALKATSRIHNRAGITMLVAAARVRRPAPQTLIRVSILAAAGVSRGA